MYILVRLIKQHWKCKCNFQWNNFLPFPRVSFTVHAFYVSDGSNCFLLINTIWYCAISFWSLWLASCTLLNMDISKKIYVSYNEHLYMKYLNIFLTRRQAIKVYGRARKFVPKLKHSLPVYLLGFNIGKGYC